MTSMEPDPEDPGALRRELDSLGPRELVLRAYDLLTSGPSLPKELGETRAKAYFTLAEQLTHAEADRARAREELIKFCLNQEYVPDEMKRRAVVAADPATTPRRLPMDGDSIALLGFEVALGAGMIAASVVTGHVVSILATIAAVIAFIAALIAGVGLALPRFIGFTRQCSLGLGLLAIAVAAAAGVAELATGSGTSTPAGSTSSTIRSSTADPTGP